MPNPLVTIRTFQFLPEAEAAKLHLANEGIHAYLADAETINMDWMLGNALGFIKLQVPADQSEKAATILEPRGAELSDDGDYDVDRIKCLSCDTLLPAEASSCPSCGWTYSEVRDGSFE